MSEDVPMRSVLLRTLLVIVVMAAILAPAAIAPARTISLPKTMSGTRWLGTVDARPQRVLFDFPATHIGFSWFGEEGTGVRFRVMDADGNKGPWQRARQNHDVESGDRHYTGVIAVDRASGVMWQGVSSKDAEMGPVLLDYLNTADGERYLQRVPITAAAAAPTPDIVTRAEWGADESLKSTSGGCRRTFYRPQQMFVHHTAGSNFDEDPYATMRAIYWYHTVRQGWCDLGYNFVIAHDGTIFEGRWARNYANFELHDGESRDGRIVTGAHVSGYNSGSIGISLMGNFSQVKLPAEARRSLAELLAWEADRHNLKPQGTHLYRNPDSGSTRSLPYIAGHRDAGTTECPGNYVYRSLPAIRKDTKAAMGLGKMSTGLTLVSTTPTVYLGESATFTGTLVDESGAPMVGRSVSTYRNVPGGVWKPGPTAVTAADGTFALTLNPRKNTRLIAVYDGDEMNWGATSHAAAVRVRPLVGIQALNGANDGSGTTHYPNGTTTVPIGGTVRPKHPGGAVVLRVSRVNSDGTYTLLSKVRVTLDAASAYHTDFVVPHPAAGTFRALTWFTGDEDHAKSPSPELFFTIDG
jgi:hypothetical protein